MSQPMMPTTPSAAMVARQPYWVVSQLPRMGLVQAISPSPVSALDMTCAPSTGWYRSRTMARPAMTTAPSAMPCALRMVISMFMSGASMQPKPDRAYSAMPVSRMGRRPKRSDSGPHTSCEQPNASTMA